MAKPLPPMPPEALIPRRNNRVAWLAKSDEIAPLEPQVGPLGDRLDVVRFLGRTTGAAIGMGRDEARA
jgi:hypothetical protein